MIKRPLVWMLGAYLLGICIAMIKQSTLVGVSTVIFWLLANTVYCLRRKAGILLKLIKLIKREDKLVKKMNMLVGGKDKKLAGMREYFLWLLPLLLSLGFVITENQLKPPPIYHVFEQEVPCELTGSIKMIVTKQQGKVLYVTNNYISLIGGDRYTCENVVVYSSNDLLYQIGNQITVQGFLQKFKKVSNPGQFNEELYYKIENIDFKMTAEQIAITDSEASGYHAFLMSLKNRLVGVYNCILPTREAGTTIAMLLGEKYLLEDEVKQLYQENGITHILAISGLHVSLIGMCVFWVLRRCKLPIIMATAVTVFFLYSYGELTNFSVSTNRAVVMMVILLCATIFGKTYDLLTAAALSALVILLQNPLQLFSVGFLLSFLAIAGIAVILPTLNELFPITKAVSNGLFMSISAMAATTPMVLYFFYQYPLYGIITNLIILPFITILTLASLLAGFLGMLYEPLGVFAIGGANYILKLYDMVCKGICKLPNHIIIVGKPAPFLIVLSFFLIILFVWLGRKYKNKYLIILLLLSQAILFLPPVKSDLRITLLDVGQGDAIFMKTSKGTSFLIDGGSASVSKVGEYRIVPFLKSQGVEELDYVILSHMDQDHINGITQMIEEELFSVTCLVLPMLQEKEKAYYNLENLAVEKGISLRYIEAGDYIREGRLEMECLHPSADDTIFSSNAGSTVLSVTYGEFDMLLTGDLEAEGEKLLLQRLKDEEYQRLLGITPATDYDVLKIAHHGSKYSTSEELLDLLRPEYALISCSKNNKYGHPHKELLKRLSDTGSEALITYNTGAITLTTDGHQLKISPYR